MILTGDRSPACEVDTIVRPWWRKEELPPSRILLALRHHLMESKQNTNNQTPIQNMAQQAMEDMKKTIDLLRQQRININRLIQTVPSDKPIFLMVASNKIEEESRSTRTQLNLWMQKQIRNSKESELVVPVEEREAPDHSRYDPSALNFGIGHNYRIEHTYERGPIERCDHAECWHFSGETRGSVMAHAEGHDTVLTFRNGRWTAECPMAGCFHFAPDAQK